MNMNIYAVFDSKLACFGRPWFQMTSEAAIREFSDAVNDGSNPNNQWFRHPEDFSLFIVGEFEDSLGVLTPCNPRSLVTASALKRSDVGRNFDASAFSDVSTIDDRVPKALRRAAFESVGEVQSKKVPD